jgi:vancomycin resistance protein YoaR
MKIEIYGTDDGRTTEIKDHEVWGYTPPLPTEYYPDPTLPTGTRKQIDWAVGGAKAKFTHIIRDAAGNVTQEHTYHSNYQPWSAKYLVGE